MPDSPRPARPGARIQMADIAGYQQQRAGARAGRQDPHAGAGVGVHLAARRAVQPDRLVYVATEGNGRVDQLGGQGAVNAIYARPLFGRDITASLTWRW